jgi:sialate O-acetylesterase
VRIAGDGRPATRVRYGWADSPVTNLYDEAPLPVGPFEVPIQ